jgi:hypothetical protein
MLKTLSYFNLIFSVIYFLVYLQNGGFGPVSALVGVVVFSWMVLRGLENEQKKWPLLQWVSAVMSFIFAGLTGYGAVVLLLDAMEYHYYPLQVLLLIVSGFLFTATVLVQLFRAYCNNYSKIIEQPFDN